MKAVNVADADIPDSIPHDKFAKWAGGHARSKALEVFTPNYDMLIEIALEKAFVPVFDGFAGTHKPFFLPELVERESMMPSRDWVRIWKIHGSVNWELSSTPAGNRICRTASRSATHLILPSHLKYDESRKQPYLAMLGRLSKLVDQEDALLIILGYSFSDDHINAAIIDSLERRRRAHAILLSYNDVDTGSRSVKTAQELSNLTVAGPNAAVIGGHFDDWSDKIDPDDAHAAAVGDSIQLPESAAGTRTRMLLGDFNRFCSFLESMTD
ncbi:MAG: SIR2 family protein [Nitrospiraceae bacterium]|nr:SIR2 family protein [Nitrospiraceae bacterium]